MNTFFYDPYQLVLLFLLPGVFLGLIYDVFRILRISRTAHLSVSGKFYDKIRPRKPIFPVLSRISTTKSIAVAEGFLIFIEDISFWLIAAVTEILFIFHTNGGEIRIYCILFTVLGFFLYHFSLGKLVLLFAGQILFLCRCILYWTLFAIFTPLQFLGLKAVQCLKWLYRKTIGHLLAIMQEARLRKESDEIKKQILWAAKSGFATYKNKEYNNEGENEFFCQNRT